MTVHADVSHRVNFVRHHHDGPEEESVTGAREEEMRMRTRTVSYWISTALVALELIAGGVGDALHLKPFAEGMGRIGYPMYVLTILGTWKVLGGLALMWPGFRG